MSANRSIAYGDRQAPLLSRPWNCVNGGGSTTPYHRIENMKPGQHRADMADVTCKYNEYYVKHDGELLPVGVMIAREFEQQGALVAVCTDLTLGRFRVLDTATIGIIPVPPLSNILEDLRAANGGKLTGLLDAIGVFPDGRVALYDCKVAKEDCLNVNQPAFANAIRKALGDRFEFGVVEWGYQTAE